MIPFRIFSFRLNSQISKLAKIYPLTKITNSTVDHYTYVSYNCIVNNCEIGKFCSIANSVKIGLGIHPVNFISTSPIFYSPKNPLRKIFVRKNYFQDYSKVYIGNDVWIGANVIILDGVNIGNGAIIGANSFVNRDVEPYCIVGGVPAKLIRKRFSDEIINKLELSQWWKMDTDFFKLPEVQHIFSSELNSEALSKLICLIDNFSKL